MGFLEEVDTSSLPTIPEFYNGKTIFITGGTGFMGKMLIAKLLYSCTNLKRIYLLLRSRKGVSPEDRLKALYSSPILVHVSTSFSNINCGPIDEVMYPPYADWRQVIDICENTDEHSLQVLTAKFLGTLDNTYVFTKQMAEHMVYEERGKLPVVIIRPSIVICSVLEPIPGWSESFNGPYLISAAAAKGALRILYCEPNSELDFIPVDWAIRHFIIAAWLRGTRKLQITDDIPIYHCCAGDLIKVTMKALVDGGGTSLSILLTTLCGQLIVLSPIPSLWSIFGLLKIQRKIYTGNLAYEYFITHHWNFINKNFMNIRAAIKPEDVDQFYYDLEGLDVLEYLNAAFRVTRRIMMKERDEDTPKARAHLWRMTILDKTLKVLILGLILWKITQTNVLECALNYLYNVSFAL